MESTSTLVFFYFYLTPEYHTNLLGPIELHATTDTLQAEGFLGGSGGILLLYKDPVIRTTLHSLRIIHHGGRNWKRRFTS